MTEGRVQARSTPLYERCRYDGEPYPCPTHVGCYAAGFDGCQDVRTTVEEESWGRTTTTKCHLCGNFFGAMSEPRSWYDPAHPDYEEQAHV